MTSSIAKTDSVKLTEYVYDNLDLTGVVATYEGSIRQLGDSVIVRFINDFFVMSTQYLEINKIVFVTCDGGLERTAKRIAEMIMNNTEKRKWEAFACSCKIRPGDSGVDICECIYGVTYKKESN